MPPKEMNTVWICLISLLFNHLSSAQGKGFETEFRQNHF